MKMSLLLTLSVAQGQYALPLGSVTETLSVSKINVSMPKPLVNASSNSPGNGSDGLLGNRTKPVRQESQAMQGDSQGTQRDDRCVSMLELNRIYCMNCLEGLKQIDNNSVDLILCDLPYGVTRNKKTLHCLLMSFGCNIKG